MPTIAMESKLACNNPKGWAIEKDLINHFLRNLDQAIHEAKDMLIERFEWICEQDESSARFMYENGLMAGYKPEEGIRSALKHGTLAVG